ncbi:MAG: hypothetical protein KGS72_14410 [Cyanobacteria bacterium REEB67]|nr:hypothetical protein [Cyanobacteria bacterium REEB67]
MQNLWRKTSRHRLIILFAVLAATVYFVPLQKFITLGRFQHWGLAISLLAVGYLLQTIWSWKDFSRWARIAYLSSCLFWTIVAATFYNNPWLDSKMALQTPANEQARPFLVGGYLILFIYLGAVYAKWAREEEKEKALAQLAPEKTNPEKINPEKTHLEKGE